MIAQKGVQPNTGWTRAEVSGWDRAGGYFVERSLFRMEGTRMLIQLRRPMALHSLLFVRQLLEHGSLEKEPRIMQVARSQKNKGEGYVVQCRAPKEWRKPSRDED